MSRYHTGDPEIDAQIDAHHERVRGSSPDDWMETAADAISSVHGLIQQAAARWAAAQRRALGLPEQAPIFGTLAWEEEQKVIAARSGPGKPVVVPGAGDDSPTVVPAGDAKK